MRTKLQFSSTLERQQIYLHTEELGITVLEQYPLANIPLEKPLPNPNPNPV